MRAPPPEELSLFYDSYTQYIVVRQDGTTIYTHNQEKNMDLNGFNHRDQFLQKGGEENFTS
jgi:hypothetical protein